MTTTAVDTHTTHSVKQIIGRRTQDLRATAEETLMNAIATLPEQSATLHHIPDTSLKVPSTTTTTTLFDLIATMQDSAQPEDEALIVPTVAQWIRSGRITFQRDIRPLLHES